MADIELALLSRAIMVGGIDDLVAAQLDARLFFDPEARAVFETCVDHYRTWRQSMSRDSVKRHHPNFNLVAATDELGYLIKEFRQDRMVKTVITKLMEMNIDAAKADAGDRELRSNLCDIFLERAREAAAMVPMQNVERFSDMDRRMEEIRADQRAGTMPGVPTGISGLDQYVRSINFGEFFVHCGFSGNGKTQGLVRSSVPAYKAGDVVLMNSLEMSPAEIWEIYDAEAARLSRRAIRFRELGDPDYARYAETAARVRMAKNDIIYTRVETVDALQAMVDRYGAQTVCVDYISLMESQRRAHSDWERVKDVSKSLKRMAGDMNVRVYAAAQSAKPAATDGPTEENIAGYVGIFQDCNVMVGYHQTADWSRVGKVQIRLLKNRNGDKGPPGDSGYYEAYEHWDRDRMIFEEWTPQHEWMAKAKADPSNAS